MSFRRLHLSATYVIKKVSFQKSTDYKMNCYSSRCINYCTFFLTLWFNGYFSEKKAASMTHAANKCDLQRHSVLVCARDVQSCSWIRIEAKLSRIVVLQEQNWERLVCALVVGISQWFFSFCRLYLPLGATSWESHWVRFKSEKCCLQWRIRHWKIPATNTQTKCSQSCS